MKPINVLGRTVIVDQNHLLALAKKDYYFLPGGHVEYDEGVKATITRECEEEFSGQVKLGNFLGVMEHSFDEGEGPYHELCFLFAGELENVKYPDVPQSNEGDLKCEWLPLDKLDECNLLPGPMADFVRDNVDKLSVWVSTME